MPGRLTYQSWGREKPVDFVSAMRGMLAVQDPRLRRFTAWDVPSNPEKDGRLISALLRARLVMAAFDNPERPVALAWASPVNRALAELHFTAITRKPALIRAAAPVFAAEALKIWPALFCLIPRVFYGARRIALEAGFTESGRLPLACMLVGMGKICAGVIYTRTRKSEDAAYENYLA